MAKRRKLSLTIVGSSASTRGALGWPCFHCSRPLSKCRKGRPCCARCKGKRAH